MHSCPKLTSYVAMHKDAASVGAVHDNAALGEACSDVVDQCRSHIEDSGDSHCFMLRHICNAIPPESISIDFHVDCDISEEDNVDHLWALACQNLPYEFSITSSEDDLNKYIHGDMAAACTADLANHNCVEVLPMASNEICLMVKMICNLNDEDVSNLECGGDADVFSEAEMVEKYCATSIWDDCKDEDVNVNGISSMQCFAAVGGFLQSLGGMPIPSLLPCYIEAEEGEDQPDPASIPKECKAKILAINDGCDGGGDQNPCDACAANGADACFDNGNFKEELASMGCEAARACGPCYPGDESGGGDGGGDEGGDFVGCSLASGNLALGEDSAAPLSADSQCCTDLIVASDAMLFAGASAEAYLTAESCAADTCGAAYGYAVGAGESIGMLAAGTAAAWGGACAALNAPPAFVGCSLASGNLVLGEDSAAPLSADSQCCTALI
ncbi:hypothetical protein ScalyP_jg9795 [Parmales sp. scaly parma]|nr:hypothetical protein ScalyP_jg9795 [Parmales sp. scaly parma]